MLNNGYLGLIRQTEKYQYNMSYAVDISYNSFGSTYGMDYVTIVKGMGVSKKGD